MKQNLDFTEIKEFCDKVGLNCQIIDEGVIITKPKDIWDGVEFAECVAFSDAHGKTNGLLTFGKIYRVSNIVFGSTDCHIINDEGYEGNCMLNLLKPSTESAYINQLKKEAFERFGEIKEGDLFDRSVLGYLDGEIHFIHNAGYKKGFTYNKDDDRLYFDNLVIYKQGKWATRVKERVEVKNGSEKSGEGASFSFKFHNLSERPDFWEMQEFVRSQLEKYLNGEVE